MLRKIPTAKAETGLLELDEGRVGLERAIGEIEERVEETDGATRVRDLQEIPSNYSWPPIIG